MPSRCQAFHVGQFGPRTNGALVETKHCDPRQDACLDRHVNCTIDEQYIYEGYGAMPKPSFTSKMSPLHVSDRIAAGWTEQELDFAIAFGLVAQPHGAESGHCRIGYYETQCVTVSGEKVYHLERKPCPKSNVGAVATAPSVECGGGRKSACKTLGVQAGGHSEKLLMVDGGDSILKNSSESEVASYEALIGDPLQRFAPIYNGASYTSDGERRVLKLQNLLQGFNQPHVMDCKLGQRTYLESECINMTPRKELYDKLMKLDPELVTKEEHQLQAVTKWRYMTAREEMSSSASLGFRIEGMSHPKGSNDLPVVVKTLRERSQVVKAMSSFLKTAVPDAERRRLTRDALLGQLADLEAASRISPFVRGRELIGSSVLFCIDSTGKCAVRLIDLAKCTPLPGGVSVSHMAPWSFGNHEDGWLYGLSSLQAALAESATAP